MSGSCSSRSSSTRQRDARSELTFQVTGSTGGQLSSAARVDRCDSPQDAPTLEFVFVTWFQPAP